MEKINAALRKLIREGKHPRVKGDISGGLSGDISGLSGDISGGLRGYISSGLHGDISGLRGDISGLSGDISGLSGDISGLRGDIKAGKYPGLSIIMPDADEIARLDRVREVVLAAPKRLSMDQWHSGNWTPDHTPEEVHACKSAHCIAGWLQALNPDKKVRRMGPLGAGRLLAPASAHMFFASDETARKWLENRDYAKQ